MTVTLGRAVQLHPTYTVCLSAVAEMAFLLTSIIVFVFFKHFLTIKNLSKDGFMELF